MTSRELVYKTLNFENPERAPRQLWLLPWALDRYPDELKKIQHDFPNDIVTSPGYHSSYPKTYGNPTDVGEFIDEWGCKFINKEKGVIGEVKEPIVRPDDEEWDDLSNIHFPEEWLTIDSNRINEFCRKTDKFVMAGCCPRPFEQLQFLRGTEQLYIDLILKPEKMLVFIKKMHDLYCRLLASWANTEVDALFFMDDWGSQNNLLINPKLWLEYFKPMYQDYINIAHCHGKKIFMHSDGFILEIFPHLVEMGLDAINSQLFCMGLDKLKEFSGKITFWGEIDRQHILPEGSLQSVEAAVERVKEALWSNGGCIAQCEFGPGAKPENVYKVYESWNKT